jgi:hypothetical protein
LSGRHLVEETEPVAACLGGGNSLHVYIVQLQGLARNIGLPGRRPKR